MAKRKLKDLSIPADQPHYQESRQEGGDQTDENFINNPDHPIKAKARKDAQKQP
jgi:hypothetical protein